MKAIRILSIGNSFSVDTMEYVAKIAQAAGFETVVLGNLYIGGCSVQRHWNNLQEDLSVYTYYTNRGDGWDSIPNGRICDAVQKERWDWISIQHGTGDGSRYTKEESYEKLPDLVQQVRALAWDGVKIAFNMTWVGEPDHSHPEIVSYGGDTALMYRKIAELTERLIVPMAGIDRVVPTGTAVQNARTSALPILTRDGYHLSYGAGRYLAGLTFLQALIGMRIDELNWAPDGMKEYEKRVSLESARNALEKPFEVTPVSVQKTDLN